ncbi:response regulator, partial [Aeromonas jandaei]
VDGGRRARAHQPKEKRPGLLRTAPNQPKDVEEGFSSGASDYLAKHFCKEELFARVKALLEAKAGRASLGENRLLKQEIEHRLTLQERLHQDQMRLLAPPGEGAGPPPLIDGQGTGRFVSRGLARPPRPGPG